jgi:hypothetical protein
MILDDPPNQIAGRGALPSGKHLKLLEDDLRKFHCSLHDNHCPMSSPSMELVEILKTVIHRGEDRRSTSGALLPVPKWI